MRTRDETASQVTSVECWLQLIIGDYGLSHDEERVQIGLWSIFASQLFMSVDLRTINNVSRALLLNKRVVAINQDVLGIPGRHVLSVSLSVTFLIVIFSTATLSVHANRCHFTHRTYFM